jgi:hypothetical protein
VPAPYHVIVHKFSLVVPLCFCPLPDAKKIPEMGDFMLLGCKRLETAGIAVLDRLFPMKTAGGAAGAKYPLSSGWHYYREQLEGSFALF